MKRLIAALLLTATPVMAFDISAMTEAEKDAFGTAIRDYLMANPEVLIESINVLEDRRAAEAAANDVALVSANADALFEDGYSWIGGNPDGDVTVVEFVDYKCGYCKRAFSEVEQLVESDGDIRLILKDLPVLGQQSELGARFAIAVKQLHDDGTYKSVHDALMRLRGDISVARLTTLAEEQGLDAVPLIQRMNEDDVTDVLRANRQLAERLSIQGTPAFVVGHEGEDDMQGLLLRGYLPLEGMQQIVEEQRG